MWQFTAWVDRPLSPSVPWHQGGEDPGRGSGQGEGGGVQRGEQGEGEGRDRTCVEEGEGHLCVCVCACVCVCVCVCMCVSVMVWMCRCEWLTEWLILQHSVQDIQKGKILRNVLHTHMLIESF